MISAADDVAARQAHFLLRKVSRALREFNMLWAGDRVCVAVSGGKDSLSLLDLLLRLRTASPIPFAVAAVHVRGDSAGILPPHAPLERHLAALDIAFSVVEPEITGDEQLPLGCQRCTWLRRKALFQTAEALGCNVVAYAHHADDAAQTTLMNLLQAGEVRTLAPVADYFEGRFRLIRPLFYVPETELARFARASGFPPPPPACARGGASRRAAVTAFLRGLGRAYPANIRSNLIRAGLSGLQREDNA